MESTANRQELIDKAARDVVASYLETLDVSEAWLGEFVPDGIDGDGDNDEVCAVDEVIAKASAMLEALRQEFLKGQA